MSMDREKRIICDYQAEVCDYVRQEAESCAGNDVVARISSLLYQRIGQGYRSARTLREFAHHDWSVDGEIILRTLYDATLQLLWLLAVPDERAFRAKLYLDFLEIEKHQMLHQVDSSGTDLGAAIAKSPRRPAGEKQRQERLRTVGEPYLDKRGRKRNIYDKPKPPPEEAPSGSDVKPCESSNQPTSSTASPGPGRDGTSASPIILRFATASRQPRTRRRASSSAGTSAEYRN